jgi:hypothetical protein
MFCLATLPLLYTDSKHEGFFVKQPQYFVKEVTLVYQDIVDEIPVPFEAHWLNSLMALKCAR